MNDKTNTQATDYVRICFHSVTEFELPVGGCGTCWEEVILMLCEMASPAEIPHRTSAWLPGIAPGYWPTRAQRTPGEVVAGKADPRRRGSDGQSLARSLGALEGDTGVDGMTSEFRGSHRTPTDAGYSA